MFYIKAPSAGRIGQMCVIPPSRRQGSVSHSFGSVRLGLMEEYKVKCINFMVTIFT